jgi:HNH endonuclease
MGFKQTDVEELLTQTGRRCCLCGKLHLIQVHHIVPQEEGGTDDITNAIPLCPNCHDEVHRARASGSTTRSYSVQELKLHRAAAIERSRNYDDRLEELIKILEFRAAAIERDLQNCYRVEVAHCLPKFLSLHKEHIAALRRRDYVLAHEILQEINRLSYSLETSEVGLLRKPGLDYAMLSSEHYSRGALMCGYVAGDLRRESKRYQGERALNWIHPRFQEWIRLPGAPEAVEERYLRLFLSPSSLGPFPV